MERLEPRLLLSASTYTWQNVAIGAGGFVDGIFYDPNNANVMYARTDIGGLYKSTNDGSTWAQLLDFVGNNTSTSGNGTQQQEIGVLSFAIDPENSNNIYADVGEYSGTDGAVFYSTDGGQTWGQTNLSFYVGGNSNGRGDGEQIQVDPNDSNIVLLGSNNSGLWESTNAGHSFTKISAFSPSSTTFVLFDPSSGTAGSASQTIYVGIDSTSSGTNLYKTTNGGTTWAQVTIPGGSSGPSRYIPGHATLSGGYLYIGYANGEAPNTTLSNGGVYRYQPSTGAWANISPVATGGSFGYDGVAADAENPNTVVVTSFDYYSGPDQIWRTTDANAATPTWTEIYDYSNTVQQNYGYGGYNTTRNASSAPYAEASGDGISNWAAAVAINPFNSNQLMYGTGQGIWATDNVSNNGTNTQLTAPNSWYFPDDGIEFTAVGGVVTGAAGVPLFSAMGDIFGFAHTTLTSSPAQGADTGLSSANNVDEGGNVVAVVGSANLYSTNDGATFQAFASTPSGAGNNYGTDTVAVSADGSTIVWSASNLAPYYSINDGATWTASGGGMAANGQVIADRVNPSDFYYHVNGDIYFSSNGGVSFTLENSFGPSGGTMVVNPYASGDLWIANGGGLYHSTNFGASFTHISSSLTSTNSVMALGAPAPGQATPAIYVFGTVGSFLGVYRSDDGGSTWTLLNDVNHQWGGLLQTMAADPNVFGRLYIGINGRGIIMGNPASSLPTNWGDTDINTPGNPGWATTSTTLSNGTTVNQWILNGGGEGITGNSMSITSLTYTQPTTGPFYVTAVTSAPNSLTVGDTVTIAGASPAGFDGTFQVSGIVNSTTFNYIVVPGASSATGTITATTNDQFNFASEPVTGSVIDSAELISLTDANEGNGTPEAGVMIRAADNDDDPFVAMMQDDAGNLVFEYRTTTGGSVTSATISGVPVSSEYLEIVRSGSSFGGYYSADGVHWTQLGSTVAIAAMPTTANVGLAATANYNSQLTSAMFNNVNVSTAVAPTVSSFQINDGNAQRSMIDSLTLTFNEAVNLGDGAITLNLLSQNGGSPTPMSFSLNSSDGGTTWVLTFTDPSYIGGSLPDGAYQLTVSASGVSGVNGGLNMASDQSYEFIRLYGDFDGNGAVNSLDFGTFAAAFGHSTNSSDWYLDYDGNGVVNSVDFGSFASNFGHSISTPSVVTPSATLLTATTTPPTAKATLVATAPSLISTTNTTPVETSSPDSLLLDTTPSSKLKKKPHLSGRHH
jgi:xyloglucan-specific exo-beta-1,4-glucanase